MTTKRLTHTDFYHLCEWIKTANPASQVKTLAKLATSELGLPVGEASVIKAAEAAKVTLTPKSNAVRGDRTEVVARELAALLQELGKTPSAALFRVIKREKI